jgi:hypothetical protein
MFASSFSRQNLQKGGVCIFVRKDLYFSDFDISYNCKEKDLEICAFQLETEVSKLITLSLYGAPTGDFNRCIKKHDDTLKHLTKPKSELLICGDINTNYLTESNRKN